MQISMKLEMKDSPGQLVAALKPISDVGGNIIAVIHHRDPESSSRTLNVQIVLTLPEGRLDTLVGLLKEQGVKVEAVKYLDRSSYSATNVRNRILEMKEWEKLVPAPVASMVKSIGGVERVRSMIHKDLEGEG